MTEAEWLECTESWLMLRFLRGKASERKLRLFAVACCRRVWSLTGPKGRAAIEVTERYADGTASEDELSQAHEAAREVAWGVGSEVRWAVASEAARAAAGEEAWEAAFQAAHSASWVEVERVSLAACKVEEKLQADLLREIFIFRPFQISRSVLTWHGSTVPRLAQAIYDDREFDHLPILADALEEAGYTDAEILNHCRGPGPHVRGCWVLDLLLGKE